MKKYLYGMCFFILLIACVAPQEPVPKMPKLQTDSGKACLKSCQISYNDCSKSCGLMEGIGTKKQRAQCFNSCNEILGDCYTLCED